MSLLDSFIRLTIDTDANCVEVETADGTVHRQERILPLERATAKLPRDFLHISYFPADRTLAMKTPRGEVLLVEVYDASDTYQRRAGRPVIYLDQNKWVLLAGACHAPENLPADELSAAQELIRLALDQRVILPISCGHLVEVGRSDGRWRQQLAPLMVALSRGWMMRDPILVRRSELSAMFRARAGADETPAPPVITLDPSQLYVEDGPGHRLADDLPVELATLANTLNWITSIYAVVLVDEVIESVGAIEAAASWAASHEALARELRSNSKARHMSRDVTRARFVSDLGTDLPYAVLRSGMPVETFQGWLFEAAEEDLASAPYLGRMRDVMHLRLRNAGDQWEENDLIDMLFLPCAAAYTDVVVAEQKTADYLRRVQRSRTDGAAITTSLVDSLDALRARRLVETSSTSGEPA